MPNPTFVSQVMAALGRLKLFTTAQLPAAAPPGQMVYDTTADAIKVCANDGVTFNAVGSFAGGTVAGATTFSSNVTFSSQALAKDGTAASPGYGFSADPDTGLYRIASGQVGISGDSTPIVDFTTLGARFGANLSIGFSQNADPGAAGQDVGIARVATNVLKIVGANAGANTGWLQQPQSELALNADFTNATATFAATNLSATVISGRTYFFECCLFFSDSTAADGAQFDFNGGSAAATNFRAQAFAYNNVGGALVLTNGAVTALATAIQVALALTTQTMIVIKGTFVPSGAGTFIVRAAQTAHSTGTLTVNRGSYLAIRDANPL